MIIISNNKKAITGGGKTLMGEIHNTNGTNYTDQNKILTKS
jgi:hypothetical protein